MTRPVDKGEEDDEDDEDDEDTNADYTTTVYVVHLALEKGSGLTKLA